MHPRADAIRAAEVLLPCADLEPTIAFFTDLGFRLEALAPADDPSSALLAGHGLQLRLDRDHPGPPGHLRLLCRDPAALAGGAIELVAPGGTRVQLVLADPPLVLPPAQPAFALTRLRDDPSAWVVGRAGMRYRDLLPGHQGGRFIASHIQIPNGGPVPDYVHYHDIHFQMIYCHRGWVRVVYEDQGPPFVLEAGDSVLQPPRIRHRVLESSPGLEVIEITSPARHDTHVDHDRSLPTPVTDPERDFGGQRFTRHRAAAARWQPWRQPGFEARDLGIAAATTGLAAAHVVRRRAGDAPGRAATPADAELFFAVILAGAATLERTADGVLHRLAAGDAVALPPGDDHQMSEATDDFELLEIVLPAPPGPG